MIIELKKIINSLTANEKRYINLSKSAFNGSKKSAYKKLYALYQKPKLDEKTIKEKLNKEGWSDSYISSSKNFLLNSLFKGLRGYYDNESVKQKIMNMISDSEILSRKDFRKSQIKLLLKAKKVSHEYEYYTLALEIINRLHLLILSEFPETEAEKTLNKFRVERELLLKAILLENELRQFYTTIFLLHKRKRSGIEVNKETHNVKKAYNSFFEKQDFNDYSFDAKLNHFAFNNFFHLLTNDVNSRMDGYHQVIQLYDSHPKLRLENFDRYLKVVNNFINSCTKLNDFDTIETIIKKLDTLNPKLPNQRIKLKDMRFYAQVILGMGKKDFEKVSELANSASNELNLFAKEIRPPRRKMFFFNFAQAAYLNGDPKNEMTAWLNHLFSVKPNSEWEEVRMRADLMEIFGIFENEGYSLVSSKCEGLIRRFRKLFKEQPTKKTAIRAHQQKLIKDIRAISNTLLQAKLEPNKILKANLRNQAKEKILNIQKTSPLANTWEELQYWLEKNQTNNQNP